MIERLNGALGRRRPAKWVSALADRVVRRFGPEPPPPVLRRLREFLLYDPGLQRVLRRAFERESFSAAQGIQAGSMFVDTLDLPRCEMAPARNIPGTPDLPPLVTPGELAAWLGVTPAELDWLADCHGRERTRPPGKLRNYHYRWIAKPSGRRRLIESPKQRLKRIQRQILEQILAKVPSHEAAHAFIAGRSTVTFAAPHIGQRVILRIDLRDFFPSIRRERVMGLFRTIGYPETVARLLTGLCTNSVPDEELSPDVPFEERVRRRRVFGSAHLPQGAPTSPALANLCAFRLDCRLGGLARVAGARYTRYADDLVFSGDRQFERSLPRLRVLVCAILLNAGFAIRRRKTRVMRSGRRQQAAGIVVNSRPNLPREEYDRLKAILHNCRKAGPDSQNRSGVANFREHLRGRIAYLTMVHPVRGARLRAIFEAVDWK